MLSDLFSEPSLCLKGSRTQLPLVLDKMRFLWLMANTQYPQRQRPRNTGANTDTDSHVHAQFSLVSDFLLFGGHVIHTQAQATKQAHSSNSNNKNNSTAPSGNDDAQRLRGSPLSRAMISSPVAPYPTSFLQRQASTAMLKWSQSMCLALSMTPPPPPLTQQ